MAFIVTKNLAELGPDLILAPERFDPKRSRLEKKTGDSTKSIADVADCSRQAVSTVSNSDTLCLVLDTSHAAEGIVMIRRDTQKFSELKSVKKRIIPGDVIISRLRPYLRQAAYIDDQIPGHQKGVELCCSTEFFVLRSKTEKSIAFLVPYLLSFPVQEVLGASQEGGHHPRFNEDTLMGLTIPDPLLKRRGNCSENIEMAVTDYRKSEALIAKEVSKASSKF